MTRDVRELGPRIGAVMRQSLDYLAHGQLQERWLGLSQFTRSDQFSRSFGAYAGWEAVKDAIREYLANPGRTERMRLEQLQVNPQVIEGFRRDGAGMDIESVFTEAWDRVKDNVIMAAGVRPIDSPSVSNPFVDTIGDEMAKSGGVDFQCGVQGVRRSVITEVPTSTERDDPSIPEVQSVARSATRLCDADDTSCHQ